MMTSDDVAEWFSSCSRPRNHRILETAFQAGDGAVMG